MDTVEVILPDGSKGKILKREYETRKKKKHNIKLANEKAGAK